MYSQNPPLPKTRRESATNPKNWPLGKKGLWELQDIFTTLPRTDLTDKQPNERNNFQLPKKVWIRSVDNNNLIRLPVKAIERSRHNWIATHIFRDTRGHIIAGAPFSVCTLSSSNGPFGIGMSVFLAIYSPPDSRNAGTKRGPKARGKKRQSPLQKETRRGIAVRLREVAIGR